MFKFIHAADLHIDSPLQGLEQYEGAPVEQLRGATRRAFENLVDLSVDEQVDFVVLAGDLYDGDWKDYNTGLFFTNQMYRLREAKIHAFVVYGNHDAESQMTRSLRLPDNVHAFKSSHPETKTMDSLGVAIHGQSFASRAVTADLSAAYPSRISSLFNIGMLHTCAGGYDGHKPYAPTTVDALRSRGYDYWALGHVHRREVLRQDPWIVFPGNIQGRHIRETGPKGCTVVTVRDSQVVSAEHRDLDVLRWEVCRVKAAGADTPADLLDRIQRALTDQADASDGRLTAMRLEVAGPCRAHHALTANPTHWHNEIRSMASSLGERAWLEKIRLRTSSDLQLDEMSKREDVIGGLLRSLQNIEQNDDALLELASLFADLQVKLPAELREGDDPLDFRSPTLLRGALNEARELLITRLLHGGA